MATLQKVDFTLDNEFQSVYTPIKITVRVEGGQGSDSLTNTVEDYVSCRFHFTPYNETTDQWRNGTSGDFPLRDETFAVRVPYTPYVHGWPIDDTPNQHVNGSAAFYRYFSLDIAPLVRNYLSYNLRPCSHDTSLNIQRDITLNQIAYNLFTRYQVQVRPEYISSNGQIKLDGNLTEYCYPRVLNAAPSIIEEIFGDINNETYNDEDFTVKSSLQGKNFDRIFNHKTNNNGYYYNRQRYLSVKPINRIIGVDECEYVSFCAERGSVTIDDVDTNIGIFAQIKFYDFNGNQINNGDGSNVYAANINATANGDGTSSANNGLFTYGNGGNPGFLTAVMQIGVGTRNIKELGITHPTKFQNSQPLTDFSNVAYYTVTTHRNVTPFQAIGQTIKYTIDHTRRNYNESTRFHWQCRLGGIDSYTFDGAMTRGVETSSSTYEQTIYPKFSGQLSSSTGNTKLFRGEHIQNTTATTKGGSLLQRISGLTDDQYPSIRKHKVDAYGNGTATTRPITFDERQMIEDMMSSPNVWIERGFRSKEIFKEDFSSYSNSASNDASASDVSNNWAIVDGSFSLAQFVTDEGHITGTSSLEVGNNAGDDELSIYSKTQLKYDPNKLYEIELRYKTTTVGQDDSEDGNLPLLYCGFVGFASDGVTKVNRLGENNNGNQHYITVSGRGADGDNEYRTFRGYVSGSIRGGSTVGGGPTNTIINHGRAHPNVKFISPLIYMNFNDDSGITIVDYIKCTEYTPDDPSQLRNYSSLNKNYYVPVLLKDSNVTSYDSEESTTVSVNYVESRKKRTIIT